MPVVPYPAPPAFPVVPSSLPGGGASNGQPACCEYTRKVCQYRQVWTCKITCSPATFTYTLKEVDEQCWDYKVQCDAVTLPNGTRACATSPAGLTGCTADLSPTPTAPPPGVSPGPITVY